MELICDDLEHVVHNEGMYCIDIVNPNLDSSIQFGGIGTFWGQKIRQEKLTKFTKILNYIKSSCIIVCTKMSRYSHYIYFLQEKSTHFGLRILTNFGLGVSGHFERKKIPQEKLTKFTRIFELYQVFMYDFQY